MDDHTDFSRNMTNVFNYMNTVSESLGTFLLVFLLLCFCIFLYFMTSILRVFFTTPHVRENARYILFIHMLINDALFLSIAFVLLIASSYLIYIPVPICFVITTLIASSFVVTPYNLAIMSLERYVAICHPLRHGVICTEQRCNTAIAVMWGVGIIPITAEFITTSFLAGKSFLSAKIICTSKSMYQMNPVQNIIRSVCYILSFTTVGLIILYTYVRVMLVSRKFGSGKSSAIKAGKTVMLHAFQLLLCLTSFTSALTENYLTDFISALPVTIINFLLFMFLPRFISPLIYGIRDEVFRKCMVSDLDEFVYDLVHFVYVPVHCVSDLVPLVGDLVRFVSDTENIVDESICFVDNLIPLISDLVLCQ
ncbi:odorant receptor 131-2-like [Rhinophrynus dorsalis]